MSDGLTPISLWWSPSLGRFGGTGRRQWRGVGSSTWCGAQGSVPSSPFSLSAGFEFDRWLNTPGWPPYLPDLSPGQQLMRPAEELAELWAADGLNMEAIEAVDISGWRTYQLVYFLDQVLQKSPLPEGGCQGTPRRRHPEGDLPKSSQFSGDVRAHCGHTGVCGHQPLSSCSVGPGSREACIGVVGDGEPGEACPWVYGDCCVPMSPQLSLPSLLRNLLPLCAGTPSPAGLPSLEGPTWALSCPESASAWGAPELRLGAWAGVRADAQCCEDPREFTAQLGWVHRVLWGKQGLGAGSELWGGW